MFLDAVKPIALVLCMVSLGAVFCTAFLVPGSGIEQRMGDSLALLSLTAGICLSSGMIFRESEQTGIGPLARTLPMQMFLWAVCLMLALFVASWYLEANCIFYRDVRRF